MSSIQQPFQPHPLGHRGSFEGALPAGGELLRKVRWIVGSIAVFALVFLFVFSLGTADQSGNEEALGAPAASGTVDYDGRGKWIGYAP